MLLCILIDAMNHRVAQRLPGRTILTASLIATALAGCSSGNKLETGYAYRPLSASPAEIRGFYAERFTPEARAAQLEREQELEARRPRPGY